MLVTRLLSFYIFVINVYGFNIDTNNPIVYEDPLKFSSSQSNKSSYFGYTVILYPGNRTNTPWLLIGAPRGNKPDKKYKNSGVCFKCGIGEICRSIDIDDNYISAHFNYVEKIDDSWLGGSMDINFKSQRIVTCAPRWIKIKQNNIRQDSDYHLEGACYWFHVNDNKTLKLLPLLEPINDVYTDSTTKSSVYHYAQGQAGFSVHMPVTGSELILGAPGVFNWDGTSILYKDNNATIPVANRWRSSKRKRSTDPGEEFNDKNIASARMTTQTAAYDLLGYSSGSGYFYSKSKLLYVSSAPRSNYLGQILIYEFGPNTESALRVRETKFGTQFGEYFGASLNAGDIDNDGLDDLIVGAPFHTTKRYNEGKVYIFMGSRSGRLQTPKRDSIIGKSMNGQFGSTVQYLGDINHDGFGDVAIAAPYEEEKSGVVYLYRGTADGLDTTHCQRIEGKEIYQDIRGFGIYISRPADLDSNGYSDFAIGAFKSGHVVLLRSRPVVTIFQSLESFSPHLDFTEKSFQIQACLWYHLDQLYVNPISITRTFVIDQQLGRANLETNESTKKINLIRNEKFCQNLTILLGSAFSNHYDPITVSLSHVLQTREANKEVVYVSSNITGEDKFCPRCPVYNNYGSVSLTMVKIPFALGCGPDNVCRASLDFTPKIIDIGEDNEFVLGSKNYITLQTDVLNMGENAYLTQLLVVLPPIVNFRSTPSACTEQNSSSVVCSIDNPLKTNSRKTVTLDLDMTAVNSGTYDNSLTFIVKILTSSENDRTDVKELIVKLKREADVTISGKSEAQSYSYRNVTQGRPNFTQIYQVEKFGRSPLNEILIEINVPHTYKTKNGESINFTNLYLPSVNIGDQQIDCTRNSNFTYIVEEKQTIGQTDSTDLEDDFVTRGELKRFVRQVEVFNKSRTVKARIVKENDFEAFQNRTYYLNCSMSEVVCSKVMCTAGPIKSGQIAKIKLKMLLDISLIKDFLGKKDVILFATQGRVSVKNPKNFIQSGDRLDSVQVASLFIGESSQEKVELWIIIVSVIAGVLLLLLLILGLIKAGFFKRAAKEELEQLKKEIEYVEGEDLKDNEQEE